MKTYEEIELLDFSDKVVSFGTANDNLAVKNISFEKVFGKIFVKGVVPKGTTNNDWAAGQKCAISWDTITDYIIFDSEDEYKRALDES